MTREQRSRSLKWRGLPQRPSVSIGTSHLLPKVVRRLHKYLGMAATPAVSINFYPSNRRASSSISSRDPFPPLFSSQLVTLSAPACSRSLIASRFLYWPGPPKAKDLDGCGVPAGFLSQIVQGFPGLVRFRACQRSLDVQSQELWQLGQASSRLPIPRLV